MVGKPRISAKPSLGKEPPMFGSTAGGWPVVRSIERRAKATQLCSGSVRVARIINDSAGRTSTAERPAASSALRIAGRKASGSVSTV